ncbi:Sugar phosphate isomerase/epimerase [Syntrophus gentianae]|uniref:Sugar phosphate isomerase/epimerase n=1 Tax=Syntrophus gentianae TaxID=43775 RepID=A0A1H7XN43_9BACT|nr:sugar phosphate isomerase/epimerase [Syntrophus gentianae]SEM34607.1 Sugar phosphate isomerase/epimerase [Syntrophus gentianae]
MGNILNYLQVHIPISMLLGDFLDRIIANGISPEIGFNYAILDSTGKDKFSEVADRLVDAGLKVTFHAPFMDLRPGAVDPRIREVSRDRLLQVFELVPLFHPLSVVCHPSFDARYYVSTEEEWLRNSLETWQSFADLAAEMDTMVALENVYEETPRQFVSLLTSLDRPSLRFCFDTGHYNAFSDAPLEDWLTELGDHLGEVHLHDNDGRRDTHLPVGEGGFPFDRLFHFLKELPQKPILTLEAHSEAHFLKTVETLRQNRLFGLL